MAIIMAHGTRYISFCFLLLLLYAQGTFADTSQTLLAPPLGSSCHYPLLWQEAERHVEEYRAFVGKVHSVKAVPHVKGSPIFIQLGQARASVKPLTLVLWGEDKVKFDKILVQLKPHAALCASGKVERYGGALQIILKYGEQLRLPSAKLIH